MTKKFHIVWFIAATSGGIIGGTALCLVATNAMWAHAAWLIIGLALFVATAVNRTRGALILAVIAGTLLGLSRGSFVEQQFTAYQPYIGQNVVLTGKVLEDVSYGERGDPRIRLGNVAIEDKQFAGEVWISTSTQADIKRGDILRTEGRLSEGFGNLQATMFRADLKDIIRPQPGDVGRIFRDWFAAAVTRAIPEPQASLGLGYLVGQKSALPENLQKNIQISGLTHVIVASGFNLMILVLFARKALSNVSKYLAALAGATMISGFILVTGFSPSMSRAGLVAGLGLLAWYFGRKLHPAVLLLFAAAATLLIRPAYIWGDIGWFLSFAAFAGVIVLAPLLIHYFWGKDHKAGAIKQLVIATMSAQLLTMPIIMYVFGQYSVYVLPANILVLPVVPFAMLFTFVAGVGALVMPPLAELFGLPATWLLSYCIFVIENIASLPHAQGEIQAGQSVLFGGYLVSVLAIVFLIYKTRHNFRKHNGRDVLA